VTIKLLETDLCIAGGGLAGVCAALAAARNGIRVVLIQDRSLLGGNASSEIRMHIVGASCSGKRPGARESGLLDELRVEDAVRNPQRSPAMFDLLLYDKIRQEPNITLLLDTDCIGCRIEESSGHKRISAVEAARTLTEERFTISARFFSDCTGDGRLGVEAGADFRMGRESHAEFGAPHAQEEADLKTLGSSILFTARRHDRPMPFTAPAWARRFQEEDLRLRSHREFEYGYWWLEWGGHLNTITDNDAIRHELLSIALGAWNHVKNDCHSHISRAGEYDKWLGGQTEAGSQEGAANWALDWIGMLPGKRESRRFLGPCVLTEADIRESRIPEDQVAYGGWWIDLHPPAGVDAASEYPCEQIPVPHLYGIPLRALYSRNVQNLFFAGRNISATHVAFASTRVMGTCAVVGQAVGTAAAVACSGNAENISDLQSPGYIRQIQQTLLRDDVFLLGIRNVDARDLARAASVRTSSEQSEAGGLAILDGCTRATHPRLHPVLDDAPHQWCSTSIPAWMELVWSEPQTIRQIQLIFDTGFQRELTLTMSDLYNSRMIRGPQPETVADYTISTPDGWILPVAGNYLRRRVHTFSEPLVTDRLRVTVTRTHGDPFARIFEIRVYS
jgi:hypothetical protein